MKNKDLEEGVEFLPQFNDAGLIPCVTLECESNEPLMLAWMNEESLRKTLETGEMHYWSRSRQELWHKGATSGQVQKLIELRVDCDQDALVAFVEVESDPPIACHTGRKSCFYRKVTHMGDTVKLEKL